MRSPIYEGQKSKSPLFQITVAVHIKVYNTIKVQLCLPYLS